MGHHGRHEKELEALVWPHTATATAAKGTRVFSHPRPCPGRSCAPCREPGSADGSPVPAHLRRSSGRSPTSVEAQLWPQPDLDARRAVGRPSDWRPRRPRRHDGPPAPPRPVRAPARLPPRASRGHCTRCGPRWGRRQSGRTSSAGPGRPVKTAPGGRGPRGRQMRPRRHVVLNHLHSSSGGSGENSTRTAGARAREAATTCP